jgi:SAM-dependent methyltransferase
LKITIHIGSHKAGSTAIQNTCKSEAAALMQAGVYYPIGLFDNYPGQHSQLAQLIESGSEEELAQKIERIWREAEERGCSHVFLSGEDMCSVVTLNGAQRLVRIAYTHFNEISIVLVLRRKLEYLLSHLNHYYRHDDRTISLDSFRAAMIFSPQKSLQVWKTAVGEGNVSAFAYNSESRDDLFLARFFRTFLGIDLSTDAVSSSARVNASFDLVSAIVFNEVLKSLPSTDISSVNLAYLSSFRSGKVSLPQIEADISQRLNEMFPDEDWRIDELPHLLQTSKPTQPLGADDARLYLTSLADFFIQLRELYVPLDAHTPLTRSTIITVYHAFLGRSAKPDELDLVFRSRKTARELRQMMADSSEFRRNHRERLNMTGLNVPPLDVSPQATEAEEQAILEHLRARWNALGTEKPHWSVWSVPEFAGSMTPKLHAEFYESGAKELSAIEQTLARVGRSFSDVRHLVDFGCGLGRFTINAAGVVAEATGVDFSDTHLQLAGAEATARGLTNVSWGRQNGLRPIDLQPYDFWYSRIVLQHNPPPLIRRWLSQGLSGLQPGGIAVFQIPTYSVKYSFSTKEYLKELDDAPDIEMHCLPQRDVLEIIEKSSCRILEIREDNAVDIPRYWVSNTFVVERRSG